MLLTFTTTHNPATDLGFLLRKHPDRFQTFDLGFDRDSRLHGFDTAAAVEVIEHLDPQHLSAFKRVLFEFAKPRTLVLTTPNREYNVKWETLPAGRFRHPDHRFEWTRH
jgi:RNA repair, ligase-Pnkp-associating, region of Hen1